MDPLPHIVPTLTPHRFAYMPSRSGLLSCLKYNSAHIFSWAKNMAALGDQTFGYVHALRFFYENPGFGFLTLALLIGISSLIQSILTALKPGLRSIPGPFLARFSKLHRAWNISKGRAPDFYRELHEKYGPIVRTGPTTVDISDPAAVMIIYGINSKFLKVRSLVSLE